MKQSIKNMIFWIIILVIEFIIFIFISNELLTLLFIIIMIITFNMILGNFLQIFFNLFIQGIISAFTTLILLLYSLIYLNQIFKDFTWNGLMIIIIIWYLIITIESLKDFYQRNKKNILVSYDNLSDEGIKELKKIMYSNKIEQMEKKSRLKYLDFCREEISRDPKYRHKSAEKLNKKDIKEYIPEYKDDNIYMKKSINSNSSTKMNEIGLITGFSLLMYISSKHYIILILPLVFYLLILLPKKEKTIKIISKSFLILVFVLNEIFIFNDFKNSPILTTVLFIAIIVLIVSYTKKLVAIINNKN